MVNLSHWDFADHFSGYDAAALILGLEPRESADDEHRVRVVSDRMELDYARAIQQAQLQDCPFFDDRDRQKLLGKRAGGLLVSVELKKLWRDFDSGVETPLSAWIFDKRLPRFENQVFDRPSIVEWLKAISMAAGYRFDLNRAVEAGADSGEGIDPADLPEELHAASIAFSAVTNGFGDKAATFKNRLIDYLEKNFLELSVEAV